MIAISQATFRRALPELLKKRQRQWVAYHGEECVGFGRSETQLYEKCFGRGLQEHEFVVRCILPEVDPERDLTPLSDN